MLVIGGDEGYLGACAFGSTGCNAGRRSGLVSVATRKSHAAQLSIAGMPEIMCHGVETLDELMPLD